MERLRIAPTPQLSGRPGSRWTAEQVVEMARRIYSRKPAWPVFFRQVLGLKGIVRRAFPTPQQLAEFEQTEDYEEIMRMLAQLRRHRALSVGRQEPTQVITVRLPRAVHEFLRAEAHEHHTSMNKLCISKLLQYIDNTLVPGESYARRTPRTGKQEEGEAADL